MKEHVAEFFGLGVVVALIVWLPFFGFALAQGAFEKWQVSETLALANCTPVTGTRWELFFTTPNNEQQRHAFFTRPPTRGFRRKEVPWPASYFAAWPLKRLSFDGAHYVEEIAEPTHLRWFQTRLRITRMSLCAPALVTNLPNYASAIVSR